MSKAKVLLINQSSPEFLGAFLKRAGYAVESAGRPEDAAIALLEHEPEVVIWDAELNSLSEWDRLRNTLKNRTPLLSVNRVSDWVDLENEGETLDVSPSILGSGHASSPNVSAALQMQGDAPDSIDNPSDLLGVLSQMASQTVSGVRHFYTKVGNKLRRVNLKEIRFIQVEGKYSTIHLGGRSYHIKASLRDMVQMLQSESFVRVSRNNVVNLDHIEHIDVFQSTVRIENEDIPISRTYKENLMRYVQLM
jgi:CheY-like chemotaxis protein